MSLEGGVGVAFLFFLLQNFTTWPSSFLQKMQKIMKIGSFRKKFGHFW
jgi:hypothetical protein